VGLTDAIDPQPTLGIALNASLGPVKVCALGGKMGPSGLEVRYGAARFHNDPRRCGGGLGHLPRERSRTNRGELAFSQPRRRTIVKANDGFALFERALQAEVGWKAKTLKINGRLAFPRRCGTISERGREPQIGASRAGSAELNPEARTRRLSGGVAFAEQCVLGRRLSDRVGGRRTRLLP
jgi:hypothetical protein